ncbi:MAG: PDZ domain-containing protein [Gemmatimonadetes bacterium]|nr:PDZ domain-containing protein [Gemmatimonadota bacterium]
MRNEIGWGLLAAGAFALLLAVGAQLPAPAAVAAQDQNVECRCVDADGNEIEDCTCLRSPRVDLSRALSLFSDQRPRLGISVDVSAQEQGALDGARVVDVFEDGPAAEAGIREGDIITHVDGRSLSEPTGAEYEQDFDLDGSVPAQRLLALAGELEPGDSVEIAYVRDGRQQTTMVEAADLGNRWTQRLRIRRPEWNDDRFEGGPGADIRVFGPEGAFFFGGRGLSSGLGLVEVNPELGEYFGADRGVLVTAVDRQNTAGLEPGDVVLSVDGREVATPERLRRILASYADDEQAEFSIVRRGEEITVTAPMR